MKKSSIAIAILLFGLIFSACEKKIETETKSETKTTETKKDYIGLSTENARKLAEEKKDRFRIVKEDGTSLTVTEDFVPGRINATAEKGRVVSYEVEGLEAPKKQNKENYNAESWKSEIPSSCKTFYDGCNNCHRSEENPEEIGCTKKFCSTYTKPICLDDEEREEASPQEESEAKEKTYTAESWKTEISPDCKAFYDGCNSCSRPESGEMNHIACTMMYCEKYSAPRCLDEEESFESDIE